MQERPRVGAHDGEDTFACCDIGDDSNVRAQIAPQPCFISEARGGGCDHEVGGFTKACHCDIGLYAALRIEELRVDDLAHRNRHVCAADVVEEGLRIGAFDAQFAEGRHIIHADVFADGGVFGGAVFKPVLTLPCVFVFCLLAFGREPVGALPARELAHDGAVCEEFVMEGCAADAASGVFLAKGEVIGIKQAEGFFGALEEIVFVALEGLHAGDVDIAEIKRFAPRVHPCGEGHTRATSGLDPD